MTTHEAFSGLAPNVENGRPKSDLKIAGVDFNFEGFEGNLGVRFLDLTTGEHESMKGFLETLKGYSTPKQVGVIFEGERPVLAVVYGTQRSGLLWGSFRIYEYLQMIPTDPEKEGILVEGSSDYHPFEERDGEWLDLDECLESKWNMPGNVLITKDGDYFIIKTSEGDRKSAVSLAQD